MQRQRFEMDAPGREGATRYLRERAVQALVDRFRPTGSHSLLITEDVEWGISALAESPEGEAFQTFYVYAPHRGRGYLSRYLAASTDIPVVTIPDCNIEAYLAKKGVRFRVIGRHTQLPEYLLIEAHYGGRVAERSRVPLMHHIDEGIAVLDRIGATELAKRAFCLHPLVQLDADLRAFWATGHEVDSRVLALAMEYRNIANATLSPRAQSIEGASDIPLSPLDDVNAMLIADKVQNRKDFVLHHLGKHDRSDALDRYFRLWLERLGVSEERYEELARSLSIEPLENETRTLFEPR